MNIRAHWGLTALLVLSCTLSIRARAQENPLTDLGEIVVQDAGQQHSSAQNPTAFTEVIDPKTYKGEFRSTAELLNQVAGARIVNLGGLGQSQVVSVRGSSAEQVVVLLDGVRLNSAQNGGVDIASIPLEMVDRIEVIRGGDAALYGTDSVGGVVKIYTKKGKSTKSPYGENHASLTYGSFNTIQGSASTSNKIGDFDYFLSYTQLSTDGDFPFLDNNFVENRRINNQAQTQSPFVRLGYETKEFGRIEISEQLFFADRGQAGFGSAQQPFAASDEWRSLTSLRYERKKCIVDDLDCSANAFVRLDGFEYFDPLPQIGPAVFSDTDSRAFGGDVTMRYYWKPFQLITLASELREDVADVFVSNASSVQFQNQQSDRFTYAFILKDDLRFLDDSISIVPSIRFEDSNQFSGEWIPKLGLSWKAVTWLTFKGNIGRVFRTPNFDELFFPDSGFIGGNPNLTPEEGFSGDFGFEVKTKKAFFSTTLFYSKLENAIFFVPISATRIEPVNFSDDAISQGVEVLAEVDPIEYVSLRASYTFLDHFFESTQFILPGRANHDASGRVTVKWPPWLKIYAELEYLSEFSTVLASAGGFLEPDRFLVNTGVSVTPVDYLTLAFDAKDVNGERGMNDARDIPLPERQYYGTVTVNF